MMTVPWEMPVMMRPTLKTQPVSVTIPFARPSPMKMQEELNRISSVSWTLVLLMSALLLKEQISSLKMTVPRELSAIKFLEPKPDASQLNQSDAEPKEVSSIVIFAHFLK